MNGGVDDSVFETGVIPDGTLTYDMTHGGVSYIQGDSRSMEAALRRVTPVRDRPGRPGVQILIWVNLALFAGLALYLAFKRTRRQRTTL